MDAKKTRDIIIYSILLVAALFSMAFIVTIILKWYYGI